MKGGRQNGTMRCQKRKQVQKTAAAGNRYAGDMPRYFRGRRRDTRTEELCAVRARRALRLRGVRARLIHVRPHQAADRWLRNNRRAVFIALGWGHILLRPWTAKLSRALLWTWIAYGIPVALVCLFLAAAFKGLSVFALALIALCLAFACFGLPPLLLKFYKSSRTIAALKPADKPQRIPEAALILFLLASMNCLLFASMRQFGFFPAFGVLLTGKAATVAIMLVVLCFSVIVWDLRRVRRWALWGFAVLSLILCASAAVTFCLHSYTSLLAALFFPPEEMAFLKPIPLQGFHLALFTGLPLLAGAAAAFFLKKRFSAS